jgi:hypothetical protein
VAFGGDGARRARAEPTLNATHRDEALERALDLATRMLLTAAPALGQTQRPGRRSTSTPRVGSSRRPSRARASSPRSAKLLMRHSTGDLTADCYREREVEQLHEAVYRIKLDLAKADVLSLVKPVKKAS